MANEENSNEDMDVDEHALEEAFQGM